MEAKKLGFGMMRLPLLDPRDDGSVDIETLKKMVDLFMERGFTYFDTAIMYNGFASQRAAEIINAQTAVPCTGCAYCTEGCPAGIPIPKFFSLYNENMREDLATKGWTVNYTNYRALAKSTARASACVACGQCESVCPQHLPIIGLMKKVSAHFDR